MADESIGGVSVAITGDLGPLQATLGPAQALGAKLGNSVAQGFNAAAAGANQFDAAIQALTTTLAEQNAVLSLSIQRNMAHVAALREGTRAAHDGVTEIQATSGALRVLEGSGGIRAAERFLTMIPGLGAALQFAFPVIGAIALFDAFTRLAGKSEALTQAERELKAATDAADASFTRMETTLDSINVEHIKNVFGAAAGTGAEQDVIQQRIARAKKDRQDLVDSIKEVAYAEAGAEKGGVLTGNLRNLIPFEGNAAGIEKIKAIGAQIKDIDYQIQELQGQAGGKGEDKAREAAEQAGQLAAVRLKNAEAVAQGAADAAKRGSQAKIEADHAAETQRIAGLASEYARVVATGQEEIRYEKAKADDIAGYALATRDRVDQEIAARANAEAAGKSVPERNVLGATAQGDIAKTKLDYDTTVQEGQIKAQAAGQSGALKLIELNQKLAETLRNSVVTAYDEMGKTAQRVAQELAEATAKDVALRLRALEEEQKISGALGKGQGEIADAQLKAAYEAQRSHSIQQQVTYAEQLAAIQERQYTLELTALAARISDAQALTDEVEKSKQLADLQAQIVALSSRAQAGQAAAQGNVAKIQSQGIGQDIGQIGQSGVGSISNAIAKGVFEGGKGLGKDLRESLKSVGEQLFSTVLKDSFDNLIVAITGQTVATNLNTLWLQIKTLFGFADGGSPPIGVPSLVGERGPELIVPRGPMSVIPNHKIKGYADGTPGYTRSYGGASHSTSIGELHVHAHGVSNPDAFARQAVAAIPHELKRQSASFSPYSS